LAGGQPHVLPKDDVRRTFMRLAVLEQVVEKGGKYSLPTLEPAQG
jgi:hypothetical protein